MGSKRFYGYRYASLIPQLHLNAVLSPPKIDLPVLKIKEIVFQPSRQMHIKCFQELHIYIYIYVYKRA